MKNQFILIFAFCSSLILSGCSKEQIQEKTEDLAITIMTNGSWLVTKFTENNSDITNAFVGWECKFNKDKTCIASKGSESIGGTWDASVASKTISGNFPEGAEPLSKVNGTWTIVRTISTFGEFSQIKNGVTYKMELTKK